MDEDFMNLMGRLNYPSAKWNLHAHLMKDLGALEEENTPISVWNDGYVAKKNELICSLNLLFSIWTYQSRGLRNELYPTWNNQFRIRTTLSRPCRAS